MYRELSKRRINMWLLLQEADNKLLRLFNNRLSCAFLDKLLPLLTHLGSAGGTISIVLSTLATGFLLKINPYFQAGISASAALLICSLVIQVIKKAINRPRPQLVLEGLRAFNVPICPYSFPSGHTGASLAIALVILHHLPLFGAILIALSLIIGFSRIYLGVHYLSDVVAGGLIGTLVSMLVIYLI
jgi:undecaprenyl-diphosphatase